MASKTMTLDQLIAQLRAVHGSALKAVVLYGSSASDEQIAGRSDLNVLEILESVTLGQLRQLGQTMRAWQEAGNPPVLSMTLDEWRRSADIFPMEYADILERHRVLDGELPMEGVTVHIPELRLQTEKEAMGKLLRLRRGVMVAGTDTDRQRALLRESFSALMVIFRAVLRLHRVRPARDGRVVIADVASRCGVAASPYERVYALVHGDAIADREIEAVLSGYVQGMDVLVSYLDQFIPPPAVDAPFTPRIT